MNNKRYEIVPYFHGVTIAIFDNINKCLTPHIAVPLNERGALQKTVNKLNEVYDEKVHIMIKKRKVTLPFYQSVNEYALIHAIPIEDVQPLYICQSSIDSLVNYRMYYDYNYGVEFLTPL